MAVLLLISSLLVLLASLCIAQHVGSFHRGERYGLGDPNAQCWTKANGTSKGSSYFPLIGTDPLKQMLQAFPLHVPRVLILTSPTLIGLLTSSWTKRSSEASRLSCY